MEFLFYWILASDNREAELFSREALDQIHRLLSVGKKFAENI